MNRGLMAWNPLLWPISFQGLMIVIAAEIIPLSKLIVVSMMGILECSQWLGRLFYEIPFKGPPEQHVYVDWLKGFI